MPSFSKASLAQLKTCHPDLQRVMAKVVETFDFTVLEGYRDRAAQEAAFAKGLSQKHFPYGEHNQKPSHAVDIAPYPIDWRDEPKAIQRFVYLAGFVMCTALELGVSLRWGGDWNENFDTRDEQFRDYGHFEIHERL